MAPVVPQNVTAADTLLVGFPHVNLPPNSGVAKKSPGSATPHPNYTTGLLKKKKRKGKREREGGGANHENENSCLNSLIRYAD